MPLLPSDGIRRVLSTLAGGILLEGGLGVADPCEKQRTDVFASLTQQGTRVFDLNYEICSNSQGPLYLPCYQ